MWPENMIAPTCSKPVQLPGLFNPEPGAQGLPSVLQHKLAMVTAAGLLCDSHHETPGPRVSRSDAGQVPQSRFPGSG